MPLLSLPNELLLDIAALLDTEMDISAFSRTNQHLQNLLLPYLYRRNIECSKSSAILHCALHRNPRGLELLLRRKQELISQSKDHGDGSPVTRHFTNDEINNIVSFLIEIGSGSVGHRVSKYLLPSKFDKWWTVSEELEKFLFIAAENGYAGVVEVLCMHGVNIYYWAHWHGWYPLHVAAVHGHEDVVQVLIDNGASIDHEGQDDCMEECGTPLYIAAHYGHVGVVELLIRAGADVNKVAFQTRKTALHGAVSTLHSLMFARTPTNQAAVIKILLSSGADIHAVDAKGRTPLELAKSKSQHDAVELLLAHAHSVSADPTQDPLPKTLCD